MSQADEDSIMSLAAKILAASATRPTSTATAPPSETQDEKPWLAGKTLPGISETEAAWQALAEEGLSGEEIGRVLAFSDGTPEALKARVAQIQQRALDRQEYAIYDAWRNTPEGLAWTVDNARQQEAEFKKRADDARDLLRLEFGVDPEGMTDHEALAEVDMIVATREQDRLGNDLQANIEAMKRAPRTDPAEVDQIVQDVQTGRSSAWKKPITDSKED